MDQSLLFNLEDESLFLNIIETEEEYHIKKNAGENVR